MKTGIWGKKVGMTQVFTNNKVVPVTVIDTSHWIVTQVKTQDRDGYHAVQVGRVRERYEGQTFSADWLKKLKKHFLHIKEIRQKDAIEGVTVGQPADFVNHLEVGKNVDAFSVTIGKGFQGVVRRHGFAGGPSSHGSMFKRRPGTMSFMRSRGRVIKGKRLPGHMGVANRVAQNLEVVKVEPGSHLALIKGSMPGKTGSLVFLSKKAG